MRLAVLYARVSRNTSSRLRPQGRKRDGIPTRPATCSTNSPASSATRRMAAPMLPVKSTLRLRCSASSLPHAKASCHLQGAAGTHGRHVSVHDTWQKIEHMRADAQMRIDTEMEKLAAEKNQAPAFLDLKTQVWSDFYARSMQLLGDQSKRWQSGDPFNDIVVDWENVAKNAFDNEQLLMNDWERMDPRQGGGQQRAGQPEFIAARSQLRKVESTAIARFFAGVFAGKAPINRSMDEFISVQRDMLVRYQQLARSWTPPTAMPRAIRFRGPNTKGAQPAVAFLWRLCVGALQRRDAQRRA